MAGPFSTESWPGEMGREALMCPPFTPWPLTSSSLRQMLGKILIKVHGHGGAANLNDIPTNNRKTKAHNSVTTRKSSMLHASALRLAFIRCINGERFNMISHYRLEYSCVPSPCTVQYSVSTLCKLGVKVCSGRLCTEGLMFHFVLYDASDHSE